MFKKMLLTTIIFASTYYGIQNPLVFGHSYDLTTSDTFSGNRPQDFRRVLSTPTNFKAETSGHNWIILSWEPGENSSNILSYHIYRDGILLTELSANQHTFKDKFLSPQQSYRYRVATLEKSGWSSSSEPIIASTKRNAIPVFTHAQDNLTLNYTSPIGSHISTYTAKDNDQDTLYFKLTGKDENIFLINQNTGKLINRKFLIQDKKYYINIEISDGMGKSIVKVTLNT